MKQIIIFGRSPFINEIDVPRLISTYDTIGFNNFATHFPVKYSFTFDQYFMPLSPDTMTFIDCRKSLRPSGKITLVFPTGNFNPIVPRQFNDDGILMLSRTNFTPCLALNWAILQEYTDAYLVGIDHVPTDTKFVHHDNIDSRFGLNINPLLHEWFRTYVYNCTKYINIYQTNPAVKDFWNLPFKDIQEL